MRTCAVLGGYQILARTCSLLPNRTSTLQMKAGVFSESLIPTCYQAIRCYYPEFCNLNSDCGRKSKPLRSLVGGPTFNGADAERVSNYTNRTCRIILMVRILINIKVTRYVKQHISMFVSTVFHIGIACARICNPFQDRKIQSL